MNQSSKSEVTLDGHSLTLGRALDVAVGRAPVAVAAGTMEAIVRVRQQLDSVLAQPTDEQPLMYGINTGVGMHKHEVVSRESLAQYQIDYINSHSCGAGEPLGEPEVRALMLLRVNSLIQGHSGVHPDTIASFVAALNAGYYPRVPRKGSVGASGDLTPLAHTVGALMGLPGAFAFVDGRQVAASEALAKLNLAPLVLHPKEAMGLTNGAVLVLTDLMFSVSELQHLFSVADVAAAMSMEAMRGEPGAYDERIHALRSHPGQVAVAAHLRKLLEGSEWVGTKAQKLNLRDPQGPEGKPRVQDAYSIRCVPQVHGPANDALARALAVVEKEMNSATDNPLLFSEGDKLTVISGGNFHGTETGYQADFLKIVATDMASISERRLYRLVNSDLSYGLPQDLSGVPHGASRGSSGLMIAQYAAAALVNESKVLATPATVDSIPTSGHQEDHVSMGTTSARLLRQVVANLRRVLATELLAAAQAVSLIEARMAEAGMPTRGMGTTAAYEAIRKAVSAMAEDRNLQVDIDVVEKIVGEGTLP